MTPGRRRELELELTDGSRTPATLALPDGARAGVVTLHGASDGSRGFFLFEHLEALLAPLRCAVLRYDRRPAPGGGDVPFAVQAGDALAAVRVLREHVHGPVGLWAFSQGGWAAPLAAARDRGVALLVLVAACGLSPAQQMRYGVELHLRRAGHPEEAVRDALELRGRVESALRGDADDGLEAALASARGEPWWGDAWLPDEPPAAGAWQDMDFDPRDTLRGVRCPVLLCYGDDDEWTPADASERAWREHAGTDDLTVVRLAGASHHPTLGGRLDAEAVSPEYERALVAWLAERLPAPPRT